MKRPFSCPPDDRAFDRCFTADEIRSYIKGTLEPGIRSALALHLNRQACPRCRALFALLKKNEHRPDKPKDKGSDVSSPDTFLSGASSRLEQLKKNAGRTTYITPVQYDMAAADHDDGLPHILAILTDRPDTRIMVIQKDQQILLRMAASLAPASVTVNGRVAQVKALRPKEWEAELGISEHLPETLSLSIRFTDKPTLPFKLVIQQDRTDLHP